MIAPTTLSRKSGKNTWPHLHAFNGGSSGSTSMVHPANGGPAELIGHQGRRSSGFERCDHAFAVVRPAPFDERALEPWSYGIYAGGQSILVGTPSGMTLAPKAAPTHQSTTPLLASSSPTASATNRRSQLKSSGRCLLPWRNSAVLTERRRIKGFQPSPLTNCWQEYRKMWPPGSDVGGKSLPEPICSGHPIAV